MYPSRGVLATAVVAFALSAFVVFPHSASAHAGLGVPNATSYVAVVTHAPPGTRADALDGDLRLWLHVSPGHTVVVRDYRGAPYVRFSRAGVSVNENSSMFYENLTPPQLPPAYLTPTTAPKWRKVSTGHEYTWHDGRLGALADVALPPSAARRTTYVGRWIVPIVLDGHPAVVSGGVWHYVNPSIAWLWPIVVLVACVLAAWRVRSAALDEALARVLAIGVLCAIGIGAYGRQMHGRPTVSPGQIALLVVVLVPTLAALAYTVFRKPGFFFYLLVAVATLGGDFELVPTLLHGYLLMAEPALLARAAAVVCAGCGAGLMLLTLRIGDPHSVAPDPRTA